MYKRMLCKYTKQDRFQPICKLRFLEYQCKCAIPRFYVKSK